MLSKDLIYLDTYVLQQDMRIRLPKTLLTNLDVEKGKTMFDIFLNSKNKTILLKLHEETCNGKI